GEDPGIAVDDRGQVLVQVGVVTGARVGATRVGADAEATGRDPDQLPALRSRRRHRRIGARGDPTNQLGRLRLAAARLLLALPLRGGLGGDHVTFLALLLVRALLGALAAALLARQGEDCDRVLPRVRGEQVAAIRRHTDVGRRGPDALRTLHRQGPRY